MKPFARAHVYAVLALAVFVQALIPAGFMPDFSHPRQVTLQICHGDALASITLDTGKVPGGKHRGAPTCPYAPVLSSHVVSAPVMPLMAVARVDYIESSPLNLPDGHRAVGYNALAPPVLPVV